MEENRVNEEQSGDAPETKENASDAWREVGRQFDALGKSLTEAFRLSWNDREARKHVMDGLESMAGEINQTLSQSWDSQESRKLRDEVERAAKTARDAGGQAVRETRVRLVSTLRQVNGQLKRMIEQLEREESAEARDRGSSDVNGTQRE